MLAVPELPHYCSYSHLLFPTWWDPLGQASSHPCLYGPTTLVQRLAQSQHSLNVCWVKVWPVSTWFGPTALRHFLKVYYINISMVCYLSEELHVWMLCHVNTAENDCFRRKRRLCTWWSVVSPFDFLMVGGPHYASPSTSLPAQCSSKYRSAPGSLCSTED